MSVVVSDTTPINYLILIGNIDVLPRLFGKVLIPPAVMEELSRPKTPPSVAAWARNLPTWIEVRTPRTDLHLDIGAGEDEAISLALELGDTALLTDDFKARVAAENRNLLVLGTIAILGLADINHLLDFETAISRLRGTTFRVHEGLIEVTRATIRARKQT